MSFFNFRNKTIRGTSFPVGRMLTRPLQAITSNATINARFPDPAENFSVREAPRPVEKLPQTPARYISSLFMVPRLAPLTKGK
jgi:hypothetical protein